MKPKTNRKAGGGYDLCQTPPHALAPLLPYLKSEWVVWESAQGEGYLSAGLAAKGFKITTSDLLTGQDFFTFQPEVWDVQVTNPPYSIKYQWLERSYELGKPFALLVPLETLGAWKGQKLFRHFGVEVMLLNRRVNFCMPNKGWEGSSAQFPVVWLCWKILGQPLVFGDIPLKSLINY